MKKVGILNVQHVDNYGAVLLAYALQNSVDKLGYKAEIIDYRPNNTEKKKSLLQKVKLIMTRHGIKGVLQIVWNKATKRNFVDSVEKKNNFADFRNRYLHRSEIFHTLSKDNMLDYDAYIVGSDVVWKPDRIESEESDAYFLNFTEGKDCRRIAYAASIGTDEKERLLPLEEKVSRLIQKFDYVSVREKTSVPFVEKCYGQKVTWCIDPTLLLGRECYDGILQQKGMQNTESEPYIYLYLFENNYEAVSLANRYSKALNLPIVCQSGLLEGIENLAVCSKDDGPAEFLDRIKNASLVITDSFHGTVFSVIYQRDFLTLSRGEISIRMRDLLDRLDLTDRYVENPAEHVAKFEPVRYEDVQHVIDMWKAESVGYLTDALNSEK